MVISFDPSDDKTRQRQGFFPPNENHNIERTKAVHHVYFPFHHLHHPVSRPQSHLCLTVGLLPTPHETHVVHHAKQARASRNASISVSVSVRGAGCALGVEARSDNSTRSLTRRSKAAAMIQRLFRSTRQVRYACTRSLHSACFSSLT